MVIVVIGRYVTDLTGSWSNVGLVLAACATDHDRHTWLVARDQFT